MNESNNETPGDDEEIVTQAKALFDDSVERLDAATLSRLNQGRHEALARLGLTRPVGHWARWMPATGIAAAAVIAVVVWQGAPVDGPVPALDSATDFEILTSEDNLDMLEDLEFYDWMQYADMDPDNNVG